MIPSGLTEVWHYLEEAPAVVDWMAWSDFPRGAATVLSVGLAHFPEDIDLDNVTNE